MKSIDPQVYQTLTKPLVSQQEHPYQPQQIIPSQAKYDTNKSEYDTIKKTLLKMSRQPITPNSDQPIIIVPEPIDQLDTHSQVTVNRTKQDEILLQPQLSLFHPKQTSKPQIGCIFNQHKQEQHHIVGHQHKQPEYIHSNGFNMDDVILGPSNTPIRKEDYYKNIGGISAQQYEGKDKVKMIVSSKHPIIFIANLFVILSLILSVSLNEQIMWIIQTGFFIIYLLLGYFNPIRKMIFDIKGKQNLKKIADKIIKNSGFFIFSIQCFHYESCPDKSAKIVTSKQSEIIVPQSSIDKSFTIDNLLISERFLSISPKQSLTFANQQSEAKFGTLFNEFVQKNSKDYHQKYSFRLEIQELNQIRGIYGKGKLLWVLMYAVSWLLIIPYPFAIWFEWHTDRYEVNFIKTLWIQ